MRQQVGRRGFWAVVLGLVSVATMPLAVLATRYSTSYELLHAALAIPVGIALGVAALALTRSVRRRVALRIGTTGVARTARLAWVLGVAGIALASASLVAVCVHGLLTYLEG